MSDITLVSLAERLAVLEKQVAELCSPADQNERIGAPAVEIPRDAWQEAGRPILASVGQFAFHTFFRTTRLIRDEGHRLLVQCDDALVANLICRHYSDVVDEAMSTIGRANTEVIFTTDPLRPQ